ncbi:hypothetical protein D3C76_1452730 [compost metagenome]
MQEGTKTNGINCIMMSTEVQEIEMDSGSVHKGLIELNLSTEHAFSLLKTAYSEWEILKEHQVQHEIVEKIDDKEIFFRSQWITFVAQHREVHKSVKKIESQYSN